MVTDLQGSVESLTDPQIHSLGNVKIHFSAGNFGIRGMKEFFLTHDKCCFND